MRNDRVKSCCIVIGISLVAVIFTSLFGFWAPAQADIAPPEPPYGANPVPDGEYTNVRMISETVLMDINDDEGVAQVTATFTMRNLGAQAEDIKVRFPLYYRYGKNCEPDYGYSQNDYLGINDLLAWVDDVFVDTQTSYETFSVSDGYGQTQNVEFACWANFPIIFSPDEDVTIRVVYTALPYNDWKQGDYLYSYILETGAGWKGTIGKADIRIRLPYELEQNNFVSCVPDCEILGNAVVWHYEDFEPTSWGVAVSLIPPPIWKRILVERENTKNHPDDGEAWGRLGKAYKHAVMQEGNGIRSLPPGPDLYQLSVEAYRKAITLLPNDADWHYGFAELLCRDAMWSTFFETDLIVLRSCVEQLKAALDINPQHKEANQLLNEPGSFFPETFTSQIVDLSGSKPDYLILTAPPATRTVTSTVSPTSTEIVTDVPETLIQTELPKTRFVASSVTPQLNPTQSPVNTPMAEQYPRSNIKLVWIAIPIVAGILIWAIRLYRLQKN